MRTRLRGTQASGAGESHTQEANVAEVNYGEPMDGEPEYPVSPWHHLAVSDAGGSASERLSNAPDTQVTNCAVKQYGAVYLHTADKYHRLTHRPS